MPIEIQKLSFLDSQGRPGKTTESMETCIRSLCTSLSRDNDVGPHHLQHIIYSIKNEVYLFKRRLESDYKLKISPLEHTPRKIPEKYVSKPYWLNTTLYTRILILCIPTIQHFPAILDETRENISIISTLINDDRR